MRRGGLLFRVVGGIGRFATMRRRRGCCSGGRGLGAERQSVGTVLERGREGEGKGAYTELDEVADCAHDCGISVSLARALMGCGV